MSIIIHPDNGIAKKIHTMNWRVLYDFGDHIEVVLANCSCFKIQMTAKAFNAFLSSKNPTPINRTHEYIGEKLTCDACRGTGKLDWIQAARCEEHVNYSNDKLNQYRRNRDVTRNLRPMARRNVPTPLSFYASVPVIQDGFEVCTKCGGSGLFVTKYADEIEDDEFEYEL